MWLMFKQLLTIDFETWVDMWLCAQIGSHYTCLLQQAFQSDQDGLTWFELADQTASNIITTTSSVNYE